MSEEALPNDAERYAQTLTYLRQLTRFGINPGLERIEALLAQMGNPERQVPFIHVAGTNGKGSTIAIMEAVLRETGLKVGSFTSPHLHSWRERIRYDGALIARADVVRGFNFVRPLVENVLARGVEHPTEFEISTALAFWYFAETQPDLVLLEVGLGGAIDSTNVIRPELVIITSIGMDHMDYLGSTLAEIAAVKAGVIKERIPVVTSVDRPEAMEVLARAAAERQAPMIRVQEGRPDGRQSLERSAQTPIIWAELRPNANPEIQTVFTYHGLRNNWTDLSVSLAGEHQMLNAATALAALEVLRDKAAGPWPEMSWNEEIVRRGLGRTVWPGRLEFLTVDFPGKRVRVLLDGAHNVDGMRALYRALSQNYPRRSLVLCVGMLADKEVEEALSLILPLADKVIVTRPNSPRAGDWQRLADLARLRRPAALSGETLERVELIENPKQAVQRGLEICEERDVFCVTGSLYMLADARAEVLRIKSEYV